VVGLPKVKDATGGPVRLIALIWSTSMAWSTSRTPWRRNFRPLSLCRASRQLCRARPWGWITFQGL